MLNEIRWRGERRRSLCLFLDNPFLFSEEAIPNNMISEGQNEQGIKGVGGWGGGGGV